MKCRCGGMADATDSKSVVGNSVWVQVPPPVPNFKKADCYTVGFLFLCFYQKIYVIALKIKLQKNF